MRKIAVIVISVLYAGQMFAQTEIPAMLTDSIKYEPKELMPKSDINMLLHSVYPEKLPVNIEPNSKYDTETADKQQNISTEYLLFVRSMFFSGESPLFGKVPVSRSKIISIILKETKLDEAMTLYYQTRSRKFHWEFVWGYY